MPIIALVCVSLSGCGYTLGFRPARGIRSLAVPVAQNATLRRGIELDLTDLMRREVLLKSPIRLESIDEADAVLRLTIAALDERVLVEDDADTVLESSVRLVLTVTLEDRRDGTRLIDSLALEPETAEFVPAQLESRDSATREALRNLVKRVVPLLEEPWGGM